MYLVMVYRGVEGSMKADKLFNIGTSLGVVNLEMRNLFVRRRLN